MGVPSFCRTHANIQVRVFGLYGILDRRSDGLSVGTISISG